MLVSDKKILQKLYIFWSVVKNAFLECDKYKNKRYMSVTVQFVYLMNYIKELIVRNSTFTPAHLPKRVSSVKKKTFAMRR